MYNQPIKSNLPGILGGMGTIATLRFLNTIHRFDNLVKHVKVEQDFSTYLMLNKADALDRTQCILQNKYRSITDDFKKSIERFLAFNVAYIIPVCFTATSALRLLDDKLQKKIVSIPRIALDLVLQTHKKTLIFCTEGSRKANIFERQSNWQSVKDQIIWPTMADQKKIHKMLYKIKLQKIRPEDAVKETAALCKKYKVDQFVAGCTEMHIIASELFFNKKQYGYHLTPIDPLLFLAKQIANKVRIKHKYFMK